MVRNNLATRSRQTAGLVVPVMSRCRTAATSPSLGTASGPSECPLTQNTQTPNTNTKPQIHRQYPPLNGHLQAPSQASLGEPHKSLSTKFYPESTSRSGSRSAPLGVQSTRYWKPRPRRQTSIICLTVNAGWSSIIRGGGSMAQRRGEHRFNNGDMESRMNFHKRRQPETNSRGVNDPLNNKRSHKPRGQLAGLNLQGQVLRR